MAAAAGKKVHDLVVFFLWKHLASKWKHRALDHSHFRLGQKEFGWANGVQKKKETWMKQIL